jgi:hypothetical protein
MIKAANTRANKEANFRFGSFSTKRDGAGTFRSTPVSGNAIAFREGVRARRRRASDHEGSEQCIGPLRPREIERHGITAQTAGTTKNDMIAMRA